MAKRFTDTDKYKKPFFRGLRGAYKLLWDYLYHNCDNAGIWINDFEIAQMYLGADMKINEAEALQIFGNRIKVFDNGLKWFIPSFIEFQYECSVENLNPKNNAHLSVIKKLKKEGLISPSRGGQDKDKDKDLDKDKDKYITVDNEKVYDVLRILEHKEAPLNGRQSEHNTRNWKEVAKEWFETVIEIDFKDEIHVFNTFSKYLITYGKPSSGQRTMTPLPKYTMDDLKATTP